MLQAIKQFLRKFQEQDIQAIELSLDGLQPWLQQEVGKRPYGPYLNDYFAAIKRTKECLSQKIILLEKAEIASEHQNVEGRIKNIVLGHRQHYTQEMRRFEESLEPLDLDWGLLDNIRQAYAFNQKLDSQLDELAQRTAKSYQASQHLFFKEAEAIFQEIGKINLQVKEFQEKMQLLPKLLQIMEMIQQASENHVELKRIQAEASQQQEIFEELLKTTEVKKQELADFLKSKEFLQQEEQRQKMVKVRQSIQKEEDLVFAFFSKLSKPLRRYQRVALDSKGINPYLENPVTAFYEDHNLTIIQGLQGLQKNIAHLRFDEKQQSQIFGLIDQAEQGYLQEIRERIQQMKTEEKQLREDLGDNDGVKKKTLEKELLEIERKVELQQQNIQDCERTLEKNDVSVIKEELQKEIHEVLRIKIELKDGV